MLPARWTKLKPHPQQTAFYTDNKRFKLCYAGRRSGKTEIAKRLVVKEALSTKRLDFWGVHGAPTRDQAKKIFWNDLLALSPKEQIHKVLISELTVIYKNAATVSVIGMDVPSRVEGRPLDIIHLDEYADMKPEAWQANVLPALGTIGRPGKAIFTGVPDGRNHFYNLMLDAARPERRKEWGVYHWKSAEILEPDSIAMFKATMDPLMFEQEFEASFLNFEGRIYYTFQREVHAVRPLPYYPEAPLKFAFDFNVSPGVSAVSQEYPFENFGEITAFIGEVWIQNSSNTQTVCNKLIADWGHHKGLVFCYGDATGGARGTAKIEGSDWNIIRDTLRPVFGDRLRFRVKKQNPKERIRVNAVNARFRSADGNVHAFVAPTCERIIKDFEGVTTLEGSAGEIDKFTDPMVTHISDAIGYQLEYDHPLAQQIVTVGGIL